MKRIITCLPFCTGLPRPPFGRPRNDLSVPHPRHHKERIARRGNPVQAFSLIELLISLIIISLITSAFIPILTSKLKHQNAVTPNVKNSIKTDCQHINTECKLCLKDDCLACTKNCEENHYLEQLSCKCISCTEIYGAHCSICDSARCLKCASNYELTEDKKSCKKKYTDAPCLAAGEICIAKFNAGDVNGLSIADALAAKDVKKNDGTYYAVGNIQNTVDNPTEGTTLTPTCWIGITSTVCTSNPVGGYNSCNRTVCNWYAADKICKYHNWRLPTNDELKIFNNYTAPALGSSGLQLCSETGGGYVQCKNTKRCSFDKAGACRAHDVWGAQIEDTVYHGCLWPHWVLEPENTSYRYDYAESVRCVRDL